MAIFTSNQDWCREQQELQAPIYRLHPELVQHLVKSFLEPFEAALLALCNKEFRRLLGTQYWNICQEDIGQRNELLSVWEKDFPEMVHCIPCAKLHPGDSRPNINVKWKCQHIEKYTRRIASDSCRDGLRNIYIQVALKRHRHGLDFEQYIKALNHEHDSNFTYATVQRYYSVSEARIVSGEVLVRVQDWHFYPAEILTTGFPSGASSPLYLGCFHFLEGSLNRQLEKLLVNPSLDWETLDQLDSFQGVRQCRFCETESQLDIIPFLDLTLDRPMNTRLYDRYIATIRTTWANYGDGNPNSNRKYRRHFIEQWGTPIRSPPGEVQHTPVDFEPGSIKNAYENGEKFSFEGVVSKEKVKAMKASLIDKDEKLALLGQLKSTNFLGRY